MLFSHLPCKKNCKAYLMSINTLDVSYQHCHFLPLLKLGEIMLAWSVLSNRQIQNIK